MNYFPALLDLRGRTCLVAGAGQVGQRKIARLLDCGPALVRVVDPSPPAGLKAELQERPEVELIKRGFQPDDLAGVHLVIAGTSDAGLNSNISRLCSERNILCNIVDQPDLCSFIVPALLKRGDLLIAVSTQGASPALASKIRSELQERFGPEYAEWIELLGRIRPLVTALGQPAERNSHIFRSLTDDEVLERIRGGEIPELLDLLRQGLPKELHSQVEGIVHELF